MPFEATRLDEEKALDKRELLTISLNPEERHQLDELKRSLNLVNRTHGGDARAIKISLIISQNVIHQMLGDTFAFDIVKKAKGR